MTNLKGGWPTRFDPKLGESIVHMLAADFSRKEIAAESGIGLRTLQDRLSRGRAVIRCSRGG
jgi:hypothetical protein